MTISIIRKGAKGMSERMTGFTPVLPKSQADPKRDYYNFTPLELLKVFKLCRDFAKKNGMKAYLVGSALKEATPRDVDISLTLPDDEFFA